MKRLIGLLVLLLVCLTGMPEVSYGQQQEEGVLSILEKGAPVRHLLLLRSGRFELQPLAGFGINESFNRTIGFGASAAYYFTNYLGVGALFQYSPFQLNTNEAEAVKGKGFSSEVKKTLSVSHLQMSVDLGVYYAPIIGKFSLFNWILHYDVHFFGGFAAMIMKGRCITGKECKEFMDKSLEGPKFAGAVGLGVRVFFNNFIAMNLEFRDYITKYPEYSRSKNGANDSVRNFMFGTVGVSIFLPTGVYISQ